MQTVILLQTAPVAPVKTVIPHQKQGTGHIPPPVRGKYQTHRFSQTRAQQRKEFRCQIGTPAALEIGGSVEGIEALPVRRCYLLPGQPLELDARPKNAFALPAEVLPFARVARREKIIETPVTPIEPVELAAQAQQPAPLRQPGILAPIVEQQMQAGHVPLVQFQVQVSEQTSGHLCILRQQTRALHRRKGNRRQRLGIVAPPCPLPGVGPLEVEHILAVGMALQIQRHQARQPAISAHHPVRRLPPGGSADRPACLQRLKKAVTQKGVARGDQAVPLLGSYLRNTVQAFQTQCAHPPSPLACSREYRTTDMKKPPQAGAEGATDRYRPAYLAQSRKASRLAGLIRRHSCLRVVRVASLCGRVSSA